MPRPAPRRRTPEREPGLAIGALARATGIPVETLRTWERRYGAPRPERRPSGHRRYPASAVEHLRRVSRLIVRGHRPGDLLPLSPEALDGLLADTDPSVPSAAGSAGAHGPEGPTAAVAAAIEAARALDRERLLRELQAQWVRLGPLRFLQDLAGPLMAEIGRAWRSGSLEVRHEHFATSGLSDFLREVRQPFDRQARGPRVLASTLPGDAHEGGLLMAAVLMSAQGHRVLSLGTDTPLDQIAAAATAAPADVVLVSVSAAVPRRRAVAALERLRGLLPRRMPLWIGGAGAPEGVAGVERFATLDALDARLRGASEEGGAAR